MDWRNLGHFSNTLPNYGPTNWVVILARVNCVSLFLLYLDQQKELVKVIKALIKLLWREFPGGQVVRGFPGGSTSGKEPAADAGDGRNMGSIPGSGRSPWRGHGNPFQHSCLVNPMDTGAWWATVHRVTKSQTQLKQLSTHTHTRG